VVPDLPETFPPDVNIAHYVAMAETLVAAITEPEIRESHTIPLAKLNRAQRDQFEANKAAAATDILEPVGMTRGGAMALRNWLRERGLTEQERMSVENLTRGQFRLTEGGDNITITIDGNNKDFNPERDVVHNPKKSGDNQPFFIKLHRNDFDKLQLDFFREGWFTRGVEAERGRNP
jgi:hypothetical protein